MCVPVRVTVWKCALSFCSKATAHIAVPSGIRNQTQRISASPSFKLPIAFAVEKCISSFQKRHDGSARVPKDGPHLFLGLACVCWFVGLSVCLFVLFCLFVCLSVCLFVCLFGLFGLFVCLFLFVCLSTV